MSYGIICFYICSISQFSEDFLSDTPVNLCLVHTGMQYSVPSSFHLLERKSRLLTHKMNDCSSVLFLQTQERNCSLPQLSLQLFLYFSSSNNIYACASGKTLSFISTSQGLFTRSGTEQMRVAPLSFHITFFCSTLWKRAISFEAFLCEGSPRASYFSKRNNMKWNDCIAV